MSQHIASGRDKLDLPGVNMAKHYNTFNWNESTRILDSFSSSDELMSLTEVRTLFFVGLVPWSMAGDLGERSESLRASADSLPSSLRTTSFICAQQFRRRLRRLENFFWCAWLHTRRTVKHTDGTLATGQ